MTTPPTPSPGRAFLVYSALRLVLLVVAYAVLLAIGVGALLGRQLPEKAIKYGAAVLFAIFGLLLIAGGLGWL